MLIAWSSPQNCHFGNPLTKFLSMGRQRSAGANVHSPNMHVLFLRQIDYCPQRDRREWLELR